MRNEGLSPHQAAHKAADPDHLLPGEETVSSLGLAADAVHWMSVYGELLTFKEELIASSREKMEEMSEDARAETVTDLVLMEHEADRFRRRIAVWKDRLAERHAGHRSGVSESQDGGMRQLIPLAGEPQDAASVEVAAYWADLYRNLTAFEEEVVATLRLRSQRMPEDLRRAVEESNIEPLQEFVDEAAQRLAYWQGRLDQFDQAPRGGS
jgi:hypothetical protein